MDSPGSPDEFDNHVQAERARILRMLISTGETPFQRVARVLASRHKLCAIWELARGPKRFKELERALAPITPKVLTRTLRDLEAMSLIIRNQDAGAQLKVEYALSAIGLDLRIHIKGLCEWAFRNADAFEQSDAAALPAINQAQDLEVGVLVDVL